MTNAPGHRFFLLSMLLMMADAFHSSLVLPQSARPLSRVITQENPSSDNSNKWSYPPEFHRAIECAKDEGLCGVDELLRLADELEQYTGCMVDWEVDMTKESEAVGDDCEKEMMDRLDIADLLRTEGEMVGRRDTIEFSNLFKEKVEEDERASKKKEVIAMYSGFYESVYSKTCGP